MRMITTITIIIVVRMYTINYIILNVNYNEIYFIDHIILYTSLLGGVCQIKLRICNHGIWPWPDLYTSYQFISYLYSTGLCVQTLPYYCRYPISHKWILWIFPNMAISEMFNDVHLSPNTYIYHPGWKSLKLPCLPYDLFFFGITGITIWLVVYLPL